MEYSFNVVESNMDTINSSSGSSRVENVFSVLFLHGSQTFPEGDEDFRVG